MLDMVWDIYLTFGYDLPFVFEHQNKLKSYNLLKREGMIKPGVLAEVLNL